MIEDAWSELEDQLGSSSSGITTIVVNDATRPPSGPLLKPLERILGSNVRILFATGTHRPVTRSEKEYLLQGCFNDAEWKSHDCHQSGMVHLGETSRGTPVDLNPWLFEGGTVLSVNSVEPHYFAGYTGGRKSFLPGVAGRDTIVANHYLACLPGSQPGRLRGNPIHEDMDEALSMLLKRVRVFQGNGVMHRGEVVGFFCGDSRSTFEKAAGISSRLTTLTVPGRYDLVVLQPGEPLHINLYQSEKAIYNCNGIVEDGGTLLLVSPCPEGLGADHMERAFISSMDGSWKTPDRNSYRLGDHAIVRLREMRGRITLALASRLPDPLLLGMGIQPVSDIESWVDGIDPERIVFIPSAGFVVPRVESD